MEMGGGQVRSLTDLRQVMTGHLNRFDRTGDHRAAFLRVYRRMTSAAQRRLGDSFFLDPAWVEQVAIRFAWYYFDALDRFDRTADPPPAWEYAFTIATQKKGFLLQDVLLGMNAHINNDLPLVVAEFLRGEPELLPMVRRRFDHDQINRILYEVIPDVEKELAQHYGRLVLPLGRVMGTLDQVLATYGLKTWRDNVWRNARFLLAAADPAERDRVVSFIQKDALQVAKEIERFPILRWCRPIAPFMRRWRLC